LSGGDPRPIEMIGLPKEDAAMKKIGRSKVQEQSAEQLRLPLRELVREALFDTVIVS
jgi:hypothetical protein